MLRDGYTYSDSDGPAMRAGCSITLVLGPELRVIVDPGGPHEAQLVRGLLARRGLDVHDISHVVCTHGHIDHVGNLSLFSQATFIGGRDVAVGDRFSTIDLAGGPLSIAEGVEVLATPGHTSEDISLLVHATAQGVVAIAGDVFESGDLSDESWRDYSRDARQQERSRRMLLEVAELIVPGHGAAFVVDEELRRRGGR